MNIIHTISELRAHIAQEKRAGRSIGFVPTMGNLHAGHLQLVTTAKKESDIVVVSIFVNPLQFGPTEDFDRYPRTLDADCDQLKLAGADIVFVPSVQEMYPSGFPLLSSVRVSLLTEHWCGASRPHFFQGVATVVTKLLNIVSADIVCFGEKDFQQLRVIQTLVLDLNIPTKIIAVPTARDQNGLALSSRNQYLSVAQRKQASALYGALQKIEKDIRAGEHNYIRCTEAAVRSLTALGFRVDYCGVARTSDLMVATAADHSLVVLIAAYLGETRLIDNLQIILTAKV